MPSAMSGGSPEMPCLLLGTASPRRHRILAALGVPFEVARPVVEEIHDDSDAEHTVRTNAVAKHAWCRERYRDRWILTADTVVEFGGCCLGKPRDTPDAVRLLCSYSDREQQVLTAVAVSRPGEAPEVFLANSVLRFRTLTQSEAADYLAAARTLDRAGGYDIDTLGERIIAGFRGSYTNIMGLPAERVRDALTDMGYPLPANAQILPPPISWGAGS